MASLGVFLHVPDGQKTIFLGGKKKGTLRGVGTTFLTRAFLRVPEHWGDDEATIEKSIGKTQLLGPGATETSTVNVRRGSVIG